MTKDDHYPEPSTKWRCPSCRLWVVEPMAKRCLLCKECAAEDEEARLAALVQAE